MHSILLGIFSLPTRLVQNIFTVTHATNAGSSASKNTSSFISMSWKVDTAGSRRHFFTGGGQQETLGKSYTW